MKLALNGALTIGTLDGANVEIKEEVGDENIFIFGLTVEEVTALVEKGYNPQDFLQKDEELRAVVDWVGSNYFTPDEPPNVLSMLRDNLYYSDPFLCLADFEILQRLPEKSGRRLPRESALGQDGHPQYRAGGQVLKRSRHPRIRARHLEAGVRKRLIAN